MKNNFLLLILVLVLSLATAQYFGGWYDTFSPQYGSAFWGLDTNGTISFVGFFVAYIFFAILIFGISGFKRNKKWLITSLIPPALLWIGADLKHIYLPVILGLIAFVLAKLVNLITKKLKHSNPPMVVK